MKRLLYTLLILLSAYSGFAQTGNDTTKYVYYRYTYGNRLARYWANEVAEIPQDTTFSKYGIARKGNTLYVGNGSWWTAVATASGSTYTGSQSVLLTGNNFTLVNDLTTITGNKVYGYDGTRGWKNAIVYEPSGATGGDHIGLKLDGTTFTNFHTSATYTDGLVFGCDVSKISGLTYRVNTPCSYNIGGNPYSLSTPVDVTLPDGTADPGEFRTDAIVVNTSSTATSVLGDNSVGGVGDFATADAATQFLLSNVRIDEDNTEATGVGQNIIWNETYSSGAQWFWTRNATIDSVYTGVAPYNGTYSTRLTAASNNQWFQLNAPFGAVQSKAITTNLQFFVRNVSPFNTARNLIVTLRLNGNQISGSNAVNITVWGYPKTTTGAWLLVNIPMFAFGGTDPYNQIRITNTGTGGTVNVLFDYFNLQSGITTTTPPQTPQRFGLDDVTRAVNSAVNFNGHDLLLDNMGTLELDGRLNLHSGSNNDNVVIGNGNATTSSGSIVIGIAAGLNYTGTLFTDKDFIAIGNGAMANAAGGVNSIAIGTNALQQQHSGVQSNIAIGKAAMANLTTGGSNVALCASCNFTTGAGNAIVGSDIAVAGTSAGENAILGYQSHKLLTTGNGNASVGANSMLSNITGTGNSTLGYYSLTGTNGNGNIAIGYFAGAYLGNINNYLVVNNANSGSNTNATIVGTLNNYKLGLGGFVEGYLPTYSVEIAHAALVTDSLMIGLLPTGNTTDSVLVERNVGGRHTVYKVAQADIAGSGGASAFTDLTDAPASYSGEAGSAVTVNGTEDGVEFSPLSSITTGTGAPGTTPAAVGDFYIDTSGKKLYVATGTSSSADWTILN